MTKNILVLGTYPIAKPQHGGQKRTAAIVQQYGHGGNHVEYIAVYMDDFYSDASSDDIAVRWADYQHAPDAGYISDIILGNAIGELPAIKDRLRAKIADFKPDIIHFEQMFIYPSIRQILHDMNWTGTIVYGSQNIEFELKRSILENSENHPPKQKIDEIVAKVKAIEESIIKEAVWSIACTEADAVKLKKMGAKDVIIAANGIDKTTGAQDEMDKWKRRFVKQGVKKLVLFVGSGHPPNLSGYMEMIGQKIGFLGADTRLLLVGGVSDMIMNEMAKKENYVQVCFAKRVIPLGRVSDQALSALLVMSDVIILPITEGGGSNLKTAEAILADKKVVATRTAFRGNELFEKLPNITITNDPIAFRKSLAKSIAEPKKERTDTEKKLAEKVQWHHTLASISDKLETI